MNRTQLEHIIRAAADIADDDEIVVVGSQSVLGSYPNAPADLLVSVEADVYPKNHPERWELVDGSIGELSPFHNTFGYYAQGVEPGTAVLPEGIVQTTNATCYLGQSPLISVWSRNERNNTPSVGGDRNRFLQIASVLSRDTGIGSPGQRKDGLFPLELLGPKRVELSCLVSVRGELLGAL